MVEITLGGETRKVRFSHIALKSIEKHYGMGINKVFKTVDLQSIENVGVFLWAGLKRYEKSLTIEQVEEMIDDALEDDVITYDELGDIIQKGIASSNTFKGDNKETKNKKRA